MLIFIGIAGAIVVLAALALAYRAFRQHHNARTFAIRTPTGVDEAMFVRIGGIDQWVEVRGKNRDNPVVLFLHGGPGFSYRAFTATFRAWEEYFTVVHWDQRGAGKTYGTNRKADAGPLTIDRMVQDGIEVAEFVSQRLHKPKIILLGHSAGSVLGLGMVKRRPNLFYAYVGTAQAVDTPRNNGLSYELALKKARASGNTKAIRALEGIGPPPFKDQKAWRVNARWCMNEELLARNAARGRDSEPSFLSRFLFAPNYSLKDVFDQFASLSISMSQLFEEHMAFEAKRLATRFEVPMFFFQGDGDFQTLTPLVEEYAAAIEAPQKGVVLLKGGGHTSVTALSQVFLTELVARVRPLSMSQPTVVQST